MQAEFAALRAFNYSQATAHLWVFKKSISDKKYTSHYVQTDADLTDMLRAVVAAEMARITEASAYTYLAQTNEKSCLSTPQTETDFEFLKAQVDRPEPECAVRGIKDLKGATGYLVKFSSNGETVYAVKRSTSSWKTSYPKKYINMIFANGELSAAEDNGFSISRNFDFFCKGSLIFISNKLGFESVLQYKRAYTRHSAHYKTILSFQRYLPISNR